MNPISNNNALNASKAAVVILVLAALAGCQSKSGADARLLASHDYRLQHPIVITEQPEVLDLPVGRNTRRLNAQISDAVAAFGSDARRRGDGRVEILVPSGAANEAAIHSVTPGIRSSLKRGGLSNSMISLRTYTSEDPEADAPVRLSYTRMQATAGPCGRWPRNIAGSITGENSLYENFGCAAQANLAATIDNPADLLTPRASTPGDQMRRAVVIENYRNGAVTASEAAEGVGAQISE